MAMVLPHVGGEEQGWIIECEIGMCQKANDTMVLYALGLQ